MAYSNICDIYDLGNLKSEIEYHSIKLYFKNNVLKSILLNGDEITNISSYIKSQQSYITTINIYKLLKNKNIQIDYDSYYKIIFKIINFKNRIRAVTENMSEQHIYKKHEIIDFMTYFDLVIFESFTEEEDLNAGESIIDITLYKIDIKDDSTSVSLSRFIYKYALCIHKTDMEFFFKNTYQATLMCKTIYMNEKYTKYSNNLIKSISVPIYFDNKRNKGELILNYYQPTAEQSVFILKKIINYNTSEVKHITQNYKCSCKSMSHMNKKISTDKKFTLEEELKFCNCFINKNKIEPFRIEESVLIDKLNLYKYVVFEVLSYYTDNYSGNYNEEDEDDNDEEEDEYDDE